MDDDVMDRVTAAVRRGPSDRTTARRDLEALWTEVEESGGDAFHRCVIAHFVAPGGMKRQSAAAFSHHIGRVGDDTHDRELFCHTMNSLFLTVLDFDES